MTLELAIDDPKLLEPALPVVDFDLELDQLVADMFDLMERQGGVGLAAPQVGVPLRLFVFDDQQGHRDWITNPRLEPVRLDGTINDVEGCLSLPGEWFHTRRWRHVSVLFDRDGQRMGIRARGHLARILQHETDHLNGTLVATRGREVGS